MFYLFSKVLTAYLAPSVVLPLFSIASLSCALLYRSRPAAFIAAASIILLLVANLAPLGFWLLRPLEQRFPLTNLSALTSSSDPFGIIALGGDDGARVAALVKLSRRFPGARIVRTGFESNDGFEHRFSDLGGDHSRLVTETRSRNTEENARYASEIMKPTPDQKWVLITSAAHMPRAIGCFRRAGFHVDPYPVSYISKKAAGWSFPSERLKQLDFAVKEWVGLVAYRVFQKTDALFPSPDQVNFPLLR